MAWRRKPDGRPFADIMVDGIRYRASLLTDKRRAQGPPWPNDQQCERAYQVWLEYYLPELQAERRQGTQPAGPRSLEALCAWYCDTIMPARGNRAQSVENNRVRFRTICKWFAEHGVTHATELDEKPTLIDAWIADLLRTLAPGTVRLYSGVLRAVLRAAVQRRILPRMPIDPWPMPKKPEPRPDEPLDPADIRRLLEYMETERPNQLLHLTRFLVYTGCRPIDACQLRWTDVDGLDTELPTATLRQSKTGQLVSLALSPPAVQALRDARQLGLPGPWCFPHRNGRQRISNTVCRVIADTATHAGLDHITARRFRQTVVSLLFDHGVDQALVQRITGHRSDTIETYRKLRRGAAHDAAAAFARLLQTPEDP